MEKTAICTREKYNRRVVGIRSKKCSSRVQSRGTVVQHSQVFLPHVCNSGKRKFFFYKASTTSGKRNFSISCYGNVVQIIYFIKKSRVMWHTGHTFIYKHKMNVRYSVMFYLLELCFILEVYIKKKTFFPQAYYIIINCNISNGQEKMKRICSRKSIECVSRYKFLFISSSSFIQYYFRSSTPKAGTFHFADQFKER